MIMDQAAKADMYTFMLKHSCQTVKMIYYGGCFTIFLKIKIKPVKESGFPVIVYAFDYQFPKYEFSEFTILIIGGVAQFCRHITLCRHN